MSLDCVSIRPGKFSYQSKMKCLVLFLYFWNLALFICIYSPVWKHCVVFFEIIKIINTEWPQLHYANILGGTVLRDHLRLAAAASDAGILRSKLPLTLKKLGQLCSRLHCSCCTAPLSTHNSDWSGWSFPFRGKNISKLILSVPAFHVHKTENCICDRAQHWDWEISKHGTKNIVFWQFKPFVHSLLKLIHMAE